MGRSVVHHGSEGPLGVQRKSIYFDGNLQRIPSDVLSQCVDVSTISLAYGVAGSATDWLLKCPGSVEGGTCMALVPKCACSVGRVQSDKLWSVGSVDVSMCTFMSGRTT